MDINQTNVIQPAYQSLALKTINSSKGNSSEQFEVISFEGLLSDSDKRTISTIEIYAEKNGIPEKEVFRLENAIAAQKLFAQHQGEDVPNIDKQMMSEIYDGAKAGRLSLDSHFMEMLISNFNQLQGVSIKA